MLDGTTEVLIAIVWGLFITWGLKGNYITFTSALFGWWLGKFVSLHFFGV
mgnify:CR=1 FL=1